MAPLFAHLGRDPYPLHVMQRRAPRVFRWVEHMNTPEIRMPEFSDTPAAYAAGDEVPEGVIMLLRMLVSDFGGIPTETARLYQAWLRLNSNAPPETPLSEAGLDQPSLGRIDIELRGLPYSCQSNPHALWVLQRAISHYTALDESERLPVDLFVDQIGARKMLEMKFDRPLIRAGYKLAVGGAV